MTNAEILKQLGSLKGASEALIGDGADPIWQDDVEALEAAMDIISDYDKVTLQLVELQSKFLTRGAVVLKSGVHCCPDCGHSVGYNHGYCHWCGKRLDWLGVARYPKQRRGRDRR